MFITAQKKFVDGADFHLVGTERNDCTRRNKKKKEANGPAVKLVMKVAHGP